MQAGISFRYNDEYLRQLTTDFCTGYLKKAVKVGHASSWCTGKVIFENISLSHTTDFNDNESLINAEKIVISYSIASLVARKPIVKTIDIYSPELNVSGVDSNNPDSKQISILAKWIKKLLMIKNQMKPYAVYIHSGKINMKSSETDREQEICFSRLKGKIGISADLLNAEMTGYVDPIIKPKYIPKGLFSLSYSAVKPLDETAGTVIKIKLNNVESSVVSSTLRKYVKKPIETKGSVSGEGLIVSNRGILSCKIDMELSHVSIFEKEKEDIPEFTVAQLYTGVTFDYFKSGQTVLREGYFRNQDLSVVFNGELHNTESGTDGLSLRYNIERCSLEPVVKCFNKFPVLVNGFMTGSGSCAIDCTAGKFINDDASLLFENVTVNSNKSKLNLFSGSITMDIHSGLVRFLLEGTHNKAPVQITSKMLVDNLLPFSSKTVSSVNVGSVGWPLMYNKIEKGIEMLFSKIIADRGEGYDNVLFLKTKAGQWINANDITFAFLADKVTKNNHVIAEKFSMKASVVKGIWQGTIASDSFCGGSLLFTSSAFFASDFPHADWSLLLNKVDIGENGLAIKEVSRGLLDASVTTTLNGSRPAQIVDNATVEGSASVNGLVFDRGEHLSSLEKYSASRGADIPISNISFDRFDLLFHQAGGTVFISQCSFAGNQTSASGFGKYSFDDGWSLNGEIVFGESENPVKKRAPYYITGLFGSPEIRINRGGERDKSARHLIF